MPIISKQTKQTRSPGQESAPGSGGEPAPESEAPQGSAPGSGGEPAPESEAPQGSLNSSVVLMIGGMSSDIAEATAGRFSDYGAIVIDQSTPCTDSQPFDVTKEEDMKNAVQMAVRTAKRNKEKFVIMFNSAEIPEDSTKSIDQYGMEAFESVMKTNMKGVMHCLKHAAPVMKDQKKGCIISTAIAVETIGGITSDAETVSNTVPRIRVNCVSSYGIGIEDYKGPGDNAANLSVFDIAKDVLRSGTEEAK